MFKSSVLCLLSGLVLSVLLPVNRADALATFFEEGPSGASVQFVIVQANTVRNGGGPLEAGALAVETSSIDADALPLAIQAIPVDSAASSYVCMLDETAVITSEHDSLNISTGSSDSLADVSDVQGQHAADFDLQSSSLDLSDSDSAFAGVDDKRIASRAFEDATEKH